MWEASVYLNHGIYEMAVGIPFMKLVIWYQMQTHIANHLPSLYRNKLLTHWKEGLVLLCKSAANFVKEGTSCTPEGGITLVLGYNRRDGWCSLWLFRLWGEMG